MRVLAAGGEYGCSGGECPTLYQSTDGGLYVQGYATDAAETTGVKVPDGELLVKVSARLIEAIKALP